MRNLIQLLGYVLRVSRDIPNTRLSMVLVALTGVVVGLASTAMIALVNSIIGGGATPSWRLVGGFVALCVVLPVSRYISQILVINLSLSSLLELRLRLSRRVLQAPLRQLESIGAPRLLATLTNDVGTLADTLLVVPLLLMHGSLVISSFLYLGWLNWRLFLEVACVIVLGVLTYQFAVRRALVHFLRSRELLDSVFGQIRAIVEGTKELKMSFERRAAFLREVDESTRSLQEESRAGQKIFVAASSWGQVLFFIVVGSVALVLPHFQAVSTKVLTGYAIVLFQLMSPLEVLLTAFPGLARAAVVVKRIESFGFSLETEAGSVTEEAEPAAVSWDGLELAGVTHGYSREGQENFVLGPLDAVFRPGEIVFVVGGNGSGKTTLAKLLIGLYVPESGSIHLAGRQVTNENRAWYRSHFAVVFSDFFLFERFLGFEDQSIGDEIRRYLALLQLDHKVQVEGNALSTIELSQGQRKRLALLSAYLEDRPVYLFDEWAADQDPLFKKIFYCELLPGLQRRGKTVFVITHDDHYFYLADRIIKLDQGKIESDVRLPMEDSTSLRLSQREL
jgi:putative ATP-binding cassette transporter